MRRRYRRCKYCGDLHQLGAWPHNCLPAAPQRSDFPAPFIISDNLPGGVNGLYHHGVSKRTDSKSRFRQMTKESGCIEVGNEFAATTKREDKPIKEDVIAAGVNEALARHGISSECDTRKLDYGT